MKLRRWKDIVAIENKGTWWGFHARNLQVASLDQEAWSSMNPLVESPSAPAQSEIQNWESEQDPDVTEQRNFIGTRSLTLNIAQYCNLRCTYCAAGGDGTYGSNVGKVDLSKVKKQLENLIPKVPSGTSFTITYFGGEPLLHPESIDEISVFASELARPLDVELRLSIITNGTLLTNKNIELLAKHKIHVTISIDGPSEINDVTRPSAGGRGTTSRVIEGLKRLAVVKDQVGGIDINAVFGTHHMAVEAAYDFFMTLPIDNINLIYAVNPKDDAQLSPLFIEQMGRVAEKAFLRGGLKELRRITLFESLISTLESRRRVINHCGAGKTLLFSDTKGDLYSCNWFMEDKEEVLGHVDQINPTMQAEFADPLIDKHDCGKCWARFMCGGGCMYINKVKNGHRNAKDSTFCFRERSLAAMAIHYFGQEHQQQTERSAI